MEISAPSRRPGSTGARVVLEPCCKTCKHETLHRALKEAARKIANSCVLTAPRRAKGASGCAASVHRSACWRLTCGGPQRCGGRVQTAANALQIDGCEFRAQAEFVGNGLIFGFRRLERRNLRPLRRVGRRRSLRFGGFLGIRSRRALRKAANKAADAGQPGEGKISKQTPQGIFWPWPAARLRFGLRFHIRLRLPGMAHRRRSFTRHPPVERGKNITKIGSVMSFAWRHSRDGAPSLPGSLRISSQLCAHPLESALMEPRHLH
jgi:hypothetical protein